MQTISTDITSLFHAGVSRAVIDAISVNVDVDGRTRRMINAAERRVPLDAVRILNQKTKRSQTNESKEENDAGEKRCSGEAGRRRRRPRPHNR